MVSVFRELIDSTLTNIMLVDDIFEKFLVVAYSSEKLTVENLGNIWIDPNEHEPTSKKSCVCRKLLMVHIIY